MSSSTVLFLSTTYKSIKIINHVVCLDGVVVGTIKSEHAHAKTGQPCPVKKSKMAAPTNVTCACQFACFCTFLLFIDFKQDESSEMCGGRLPQQLERLSRV
jgi:hypothetical protein